jgi:hypothetical protein
MHRQSQQALKPEVILASWKTEAHNIAQNPLFNYFQQKIFSFFCCANVAPGRNNPSSNLRKITFAKADSLIARNPNNIFPISCPQIVFNFKNGKAFRLSKASAIGTDLGTHPHPLTVNIAGN